MIKIPPHIKLQGKLIDLKPTKSEDYPALQKILSDPKTMAHLKYMSHLNEGGWTLGQVKKAEYGIILHHPFWNTGVALECALLCLDFAFSNLKLHRITFETLTTNKRAQILLEKLGVKLESVQKESFFEDGKFQDNAVYVLLENEWPIKT